MKLSDYFLSTLKEVPQDADIPSHVLMLRAGLLLRLASGIYSYLPLAFKVLRKVENIVREEMDNAGGQELLLPALHPAEIWRESGRWEEMGDNMFRLIDRNLHDFCLGMTHEEIITDIVRKRINSYRQLPVLLYQIQTKFRDEPRPRGGVIRAREFIMKDAYSFHASWEDLDSAYKRMYQAYANIFSRCGMKFKVVEADSGAMGGDVCHEFTVPSPHGEDTIFHCSCGYGANREMAYFAVQKFLPGNDNSPLPEKIHTPGASTIEQLVKFLKLKPQDFIKTLIYRVDGELIAVLVRGDRELNEIKLRTALKAKAVTMATSAEIEKATGGVLGFSGPVGLTIKIIADEEIVPLCGAVTGANQEDYHLLNVSYGRDFKADQVSQLRVTEEGDLCPKCGKALKMERGIELGHIFKLGTRYSQALNANFLDEKGEEHAVIMGCYGIGVSRIIAAVLENSHDQDGIIWPMAIAPFQVEVMPVLSNEPAQMKIAQELYSELLAHKVEVLLDDRDLRPGVKFKDADLIGIPLRLVIGEKGVAGGEIEFKVRQTGEKFMVKKEEAVGKVKEFIAGELLKFKTECS